MRVRCGLAKVLIGFFLSAGFCAAQDAIPVVHVDNPPNLLVQQAKHYVVMVSLDGFRYDYGRVHGAPHLDEIARAGVSTPDGMRPSFPTVTYPNHYTLVTGLLPEHHGIAAMTFYDPDRKESYAYTNEKVNSDGTWYGGTPLWVLAEQQGMRAASIFWPGSGAAINSVRPSYFSRYDETVADEPRIDQVIAWLKLPPEQRPHFIALYYFEPDHSGHKFGPDSPEVRAAVHHVDELVGELRVKLKATGLPIDLIVTADHGMIKTDQKPVVLDKFANLDSFKTDGQLLYANTEADAAKAYEEFRAHPDPRFTAYRRLDVPKELNYSASAREGDPVIIPNGPHTLAAHTPKRPPNVGSHGFNQYTVPEMKAIFFAEGPDIKQGVKLPTFDNVDVYPFVAHLLGLETPPVDGVITPLLPALKR